MSAGAQAPRDAVGQVLKDGAEGQADIASAHPRVRSRCAGAPLATGSGL
jgi:hypothetical protein